MQRPYRTFVCVCYVCVRMYGMCMFSGHNVSSWWHHPDHCFASLLRASRAIFQKSWRPNHRFYSSIRTPSTYQNVIMVCKPVWLLNVQITPCCRKAHPCRHGCALQVRCAHVSGAMVRSAGPPTYFSSGSSGKLICENNCATHIMHRV